jgi:hypothetical protein
MAIDEALLDKFEDDYVPTPTMTVSSKDFPDFTVRFHPQSSLFSVIQDIHHVTKKDVNVITIRRKDAGCDFKLLHQTLEEMQLHPGCVLEARFKIGIVIREFGGDTLSMTVCTEDNVKHLRNQVLQLLKTKGKAGGATGKCYGQADHVKKYYY